MRLMLEEAAGAGASNSNESEGASEGAGEEEEDGEAVGAGASSNNEGEGASEEGEGAGGEEEAAGAGASSNNEGKGEGAGEEEEAVGARESNNNEGAGAGEEEGARRRRRGAREPATGLCWLRRHLFRLPSTTLGDAPNNQRPAGAFRAGPRAGGGVARRGGCSAGRRSGPGAKTGHSYAGLSLTLLAHRRASRPRQVHSRSP